MPDVSEISGSRIEDMRAGLPQRIEPTSTNGHMVLGDGS